MHGNVVISKFNSLFSWITKLAYLNGLWLLFSLVGFIIVGFFPATVAMMTICRKWLNGESDLLVFKTFVKTFKSELLSSNLLGWSLTGMGFLLYFNFLAIQLNPGNVNLLIVSAFYTVVFLYICLVTHVLPIYVHYRVTFIECIRNAFIMALVNVHISLAIIVSQTALFFLMFSYPAAILFFLGSVLSIIQMWLAFKSFKRIEKKVTIQNILKKSYL